ncbi:MAG TPA: tetratricopeptide repeat protein [Methylomirabilota bacterium]|nr:tetratricopeptide repeat protein [Methylomirabilota bacterium]
MSPIEIFFSYSHKDEILREELEKQLSLLQRLKLITGWHDRKIGAGQEWEDEIDTHLNTARIILLLISPDFMASKYCFGVEVTRAMERHEQGEARVIPVILRPVYWQGAPFGKLQALPTDGEPIMSRYWHNLDEAFFNVAEGIRKAIEKLKPNLEASVEVVPLKAASQSHLQVASEQVQKTKDQWLDEADNFRNLMQLPEALAAYEQAIRLDPNDAYAFSQKGAILAELKRFRETLGACEQAIRLDPNDAYAYINKSFALLQLNRYEEALEASEQTILLDPNLAVAYVNKGYALYSLNRYEEALEANEQAIRLNPNFVLAYNNKGNTLQKLNRKEEALEAYEQARQLGFSE